MEPQVDYHESWLRANRKLREVREYVADLEDEVSDPSMAYVVSSSGILDRVARDLRTILHRDPRP